MARNLILAGNCQIGGITATLKAIFPNDNFRVTKVVSLDQEQEAKVVDEIKQADACIITASAAERGFLDKYASTEGINLLKVPAITFPAFHPDICYVKNAATNTFTRRHYESAIGVWSFKKGLDIVDAQKLYTKEIFRDLGYFNRWSPSVEALKKSFENCGFDFNDFYLNVKREGVFMHTMNHPKAFTVVRLAKLLAVQLGAPKSILNKDITINDGLAVTVWPIYPEIGNHYAVHSSYDWLIGGKSLSSLAEYLEFQYNDLAEQKIVPEELTPVYDQKLYDRVLGAKIGAL